jgi:hypothetical protein
MEECPICLEAKKLEAKTICCSQALCVACFVATVGKTRQCPFCRVDPVTRLPKGKLSVWRLGKEVLELDDIRSWMTIEEVERRIEQANVGTWFGDGNEIWRDVLVFRDRVLARTATLAEAGFIGGMANIQICSLRKKSSGE